MTRDFSALILRVLQGERLSRRERRDFKLWQRARVLEELEHICGRLSAPSEIPSELSEHDG